jgi:glycosyltransferase involved in cell wall biosynthesis
MNILHVAGSVNPSIGGPIEGIRQNSKWSVQAGNRLELLTLDDPADPLVPAFPLPVHALGPARLTYGYSPTLSPWLRSHLDRYDVVVIHGIWQYLSYAVWKAIRKTDIPYVVFPHGMLDPYFEHAFPWKHRKKALYWRLFEADVLRDADAVVFTCEQERVLARESFWPYRIKEAVVRYGTSGPDVDLAEARDGFLEAHPALRGKRIALFMGRIHPKKGCGLLLKAFAAALAADPEWRLVMAGPDQVGWQAELVQLAETLGIGERVVWTGMLVGAMKWGAFAAAEIFVLPSHQENFGIVVAEALACGVPVLISKQVNIWTEIVASGAGLCDEDDLDGTTSMLKSWGGMEPAQKEAMRSATRSCFLEHFEAKAASRSLDTLLELCVAGRVPQRLLKR